MPKTFFFTICLITLLLTPAPARSTTPGDLVARIRSRVAEVETFRCDFRQERHLKIFSRPVVFTGRLLVDRPDKLRWEFTSPIPSTLIFNGRKGIKCSPEAEKQTFNLDSDPMMALLANQLWSWLSGDYQDLQDRFHLEERQSPPALVLTPAGSRVNGLFEEIRIELDSELLHPTSISIMEKGGDRTLISFTGYQLNLALPDSLFSECPSTAGAHDSH